MATKQQKIEVPKCDSLEKYRRQLYFYKISADMLQEDIQEHSKPEHQAELKALQEERKAFEKRYRQYSDKELFESSLRKKAGKA